MDFRIANTFTDSLGRLTAAEQKATKTTAFDLQINATGYGMRLHRVDKAGDKNFWSARVNDDVRIIVYRTEQSLILCYVDHHDKAYRWAERRKLEQHPTTGAAQLVELRETVRQVPVPGHESSGTTKPRPAVRRPFAGLSDDILLGYAVPGEWLADVRTATEDDFLAMAESLPEEAAEALLEFAAGGKPRVPKPAKTLANPFDHPDALRRFRVMADVEELRLALDYPWEKWTVFLHPEQRQLAERDFAGPARVFGSAGTGKTIVALHRAVYLASANPESRVLLTTFSDTLETASK